MPSNHTFLGGSGLVIPKEAGESEDIFIPSKAGKRHVCPSETDEVTSLQKMIKIGSHDSYDSFFFSLCVLFSEIDTVRYSACLKTCLNPCCVHLELHFPGVYICEASCLRQRHGWEMILELADTKKPYMQQANLLKQQRREQRCLKLLQSRAFGL